MDSPPFYELANTPEFQGLRSVNLTESRHGYYSKTLDVNECLKLMPPNPELNQKWDEIGLQNYVFEVFGTNQGPISESYKDHHPHMYILFNGWTGSREIYSKVKNELGLTFIEMILNQDPDAIVIAVDGNGFGASNFRDDVLKNPELLAHKCTTESYAKQADFLIKDILGMSNKDVQTTLAVVGHSMGGAMTYWLAKMGYTHLEAIAPATIAVQDTSSPKTKLESSLIETARNLYGYLSGALKMSGNLGKAGAIATEALFQNILGHNLMGVNYPGKIPQIKMEQIIAELIPIHAPNVLEKKLPLAVESVLQLRESPFDFSNWNVSELSRLADIQIVVGKKDILATPDDIVETLRTALNQALKIEGNSREVSTKLLNQINTLNYSDNAGHYAVLYDPKSVTRLFNLF